MAEENVTVSTSPQPPLSRHKFDALSASHRAFQEVAINVTDILQDPSRSANYQSPSKKVQVNDDLNLADHGHTVSEDDSLVPRHQSGGVETNSGQHSPHQQELKPASDVISPLVTLQIENARARRAYNNKRERSIRLYASAFGSLSDAEYDFQYKFFPNEVYQQLSHKSEAVGFDPWDWACKTPDSSNLEAYNAYRQIDHGERLQKMVRSRKSELMEALFPLRTSNILQCMSWPELEYSYGLHLGDIINRFGFSQCDNAIGFMDSNITSMIIEVGRFFTELDYSNRPKNFREGNIPDAAGPFMNGPWSEDIRKRFTLKELHRRCHEKELTRDWGGNKIIRILFDSDSVGGTSELHAEYLYILETIFAINRAPRRNWPLRISIPGKWSHMFILDFLEFFDVPHLQDDVELSKDHVFAAHDFNLQVLRSLGGLRVVWSHCIDDHLRLSTSARTLTLFWDVSLLDQSLLFWYNAHALKSFGDDEDSYRSKATRNSKSRLLYELKNTYRLLFYNADAKQFTTTETCAIKDANRRPGIMVHDLRVDISSSRARKILRHLWSTPVPLTLVREKLENDRPRKLRQFWWPINRALKSLQRYTQRKSLPSTLSDHIVSGPPYSLDLCWHLENILTPYPALVGESESMRSFSHFPRFNSRLRELKFYMDNQKPSGWYQIWKDKRDRVQYVTFWAVLVFGTVSIILALVSVAVSSAQTAAAFQAIRGGNK